MQPRKRGYLHGSVKLSTEIKGKQRKVPVWKLRYRIPSGKQSDKILGKAWFRPGRPPDGYLTEAQALFEGQRFLNEHADGVPDDRKPFGLACDDFLEYCERERGLRPSTLFEYRRIAGHLCAIPWRARTWAGRPLDSFAEDDIMMVRADLLAAGRSAHTINHYRRVMRGAFRNSKSRAVQAWDWMAVKPESEGKLHFYDPDQVALLKQHAHDDRDRTIFTLAVEAGPRMSEILALKVRNVDFAAGMIRFEDGFTATGGHAGNKSRRVRSVPMTANVSVALRPYCTDRSGEALVFESKAKPGTPISGASLYGRFVRASRQAGLPALRFHDLRHSFATQAIRTVDIYTLQRLMGHARLTTTERYLHYRPDPDLGYTLTALWARD